MPSRISLDDLTETYFDSVQKNARKERESLLIKY